MKTVKRTFEAKKYAKGSPERAALNTDPLTSEYMPSYKYILRTNDDKPTPWAFATRAEADAKATQDAGASITS